MASSSSEVRIKSFLADAAILKGQAVKIGSDRQHVAKGAANTDDCVGVAQNTVTTAEDEIEVALQGGGAKGLAGETITAGKFLVSAADGDLEQTNASGDRIVAMAMEAAVVGDIFGVEVVNGVAVGAND